MAKKADSIDRRNGNRGPATEAPAAAFEGQSAKGPKAARQEIYRRASLVQTHPWPPSYSWEELGAISTSDDALTLDEVLAEAPNLDRAAAWFRRDMARPKLTPPSKMKPRIQRTMERANDLLTALGVESRSDAEDGPVDDELWAFLIGASITEDEVRLLCKLAAKLSYVAEHELSAEPMAIYPTGNTGDAPLQHWVGEILSIAARLLGKRPRASVGSATNAEPGRVHGPFVRFLEAAAKPLGIKKTPKSWRKYIREAKRPNRS